MNFEFLTKIFQIEFKTDFGKLNFTGVFLLFIFTILVGVPSKICDVVSILFLNREYQTTDFLVLVSPGIFTLFGCLFFVAWMTYKLERLKTGQRE